MVALGIWLLLGVVFGMILMAFLAIGTYQRGYEAGSFMRKPWRAELDARRQALIVVRKREMTPPAGRRVRAAPDPAAPARVAAASPVAASGG
jgi:hypothetical protein